MKILSVDDSVVVRKIIRSAIGVLGHDFIEAEDGEEALSLLETEYSDIGLILLDWNMPGLNGYEVLLTLKEDERYKDIPVMMVTTESEKSNIVSAVRAGAINYLTKPFSNEDLLTKIMECTGGV
ncbi:MAG: response regulator [Synergistaceae bacterium]|nr:response regulator [Synergistaceae bacterium]